MLDIGTFIVFTCMGQPRSLFGFQHATRPLQWHCRKVIFCQLAFFLPLKIFAIGIYRKHLRIMCSVSEADSETRNNFVLRLYTLYDVYVLFVPQTRRHNRWIADTERYRTQSTVLLNRKLCRRYQGGGASVVVVDWGYAPSRQSH